MLTLKHNIVQHDTCRKTMNLNEVSPPEWGHTKAEKEKTKPDKPKSKIGGTAAAFKRALDDGRFKGLPGSTTKKEKTADMFKLMWSMKKKGYKPHYKPGTDKKYEKYQEEEVSRRNKPLKRFLIAPLSFLSTLGIEVSSLVDANAFFITSSFK